MRGAVVAESRIASGPMAGQVFDRDLAALGTHTVAAIRLV